MMKRKPTSLSEVLQKEFMQPYNLKIEELAKHLGVHRNTVSALLNDRRALSTEMAFRLGKFFATTPNFWMNIQQAHDIWIAERDSKLKKSLERIRPYVRK